MALTDFIPLSIELERSGLVWHPEIGDEVSERQHLEKISILVDPRGLTPRELRDTFVWLPTVEQLVQQLEARQAMIYHAGITQALNYEAVIRTGGGVIETSAQSLRAAFAKALRDVILSSTTETVH
jgi:hypothetical protein